MQQFKMCRKLKSANGAKYCSDGKRYVERLTLESYNQIQHDLFTYVSRGWTSGWLMKHHTALMTFQLLGLWFSSIGSVTSWWRSGPQRHALPRSFCSKASSL